MNLTTGGAPLSQLQVAAGGQLLVPLLPPLSSPIGLISTTATTSNHRRRPLVEVNQDAGGQLLASSVIQAIQAGEFRYGVDGKPVGLASAGSPRIGKDHLSDASVFDVTMMTKSPEGYFVYNNVTLKVSSNAKQDTKV